jgi:hypothetical protein
MAASHFLETALIFLIGGAAMGFAPGWCERVYRRSGGIVRIYAGRYTQVWGGFLLGVGCLFLVFWVANR